MTSAGCMSTEQSFSSVCVSVQSCLTQDLQTDSLPWLALWLTVNRPSLFSWSLRASEWRKEKSPSSFQSSSSSPQGALWHFSECTYCLPLPGDRWNAWCHSRACVLNMGHMSGGYHILVSAMSENEQKLTWNNSKYLVHPVTFKEH